MDSSFPRDTPQVPEATQAWEDNDLRMTFGEHLEELRWRIILALIGVGVTACGTLMYGNQILAWLHQPLTRVLAEHGLPAHTIGRTIVSGFSVYLKVSLIAALIVASPWVVFQGWKFMAAGLYTHERRAVYVVAPFSGIMALLGVLFAYYVLVPFCIQFLIGFMLAMPNPGEQGMMLPPSATVEQHGQVVPVLPGDPAQPRNGEIWINQATRQFKVFLDGKAGEEGKVYTLTLSASSLMTPLIETSPYVSFIALMILGVVVAFQLPPVMLIAGWARIIDPALLGRHRKYCILLCFVLGALFTPADPGSMFLLAIPLWLLFEFGLMLMRFAYRR